MKQRSSWGNINVPVNFCYFIKTEFDYTLAVNKLIWFKNLWNFPTMVYVKIYSLTALQVLWVQYICPSCDSGFVHLLALDSGMSGDLKFGKHSRGWTFSLTPLLSPWKELAPAISLFLAGIWASQRAEPPFSSPSRLATPQLIFRLVSLLLYPSEILCLFVM